MGGYCIQYSITYLYKVLHNVYYEVYLGGFFEEFYNYNVFYRLKVCNKVNMGYSVEYYLDYPILTY